MKHVSYFLPGRLLAYCFLGCIFIVGTATIANFSLKRSLNENRNLSIPPPVPHDVRAINAWPSEFDNYINDRFGFREHLAKLNTLLRVGLFKTSTVDTVTVGHDGWLFYSGESTLSIPPFSPVELEWWRFSIEAKRAWLAAQGIEYLFVVAPEKHAIYPEKLPRTVARPDGPTNCDRLVFSATQAGSLSPLYLKNALEKAKIYAPVFLKTDSHWNKFGAFVANKEIVNAINLGKVNLLLSEEETSNIKLSPIFGGDLAIMLFLENELTDIQATPLFAESNNSITTSPLVKIGTRQSLTHKLDFIMTNSYNNALPDVLVFHDSFFTTIRPFFAEHFHRGYFFGGSLLLKFDLSLIEKYKPKIVVEEITERYLRYGPYLPTEILVWYQNQKLKTAQ